MAKFIVHYAHTFLTPSVTERTCKWKRLWRDLAKFVKHQEMYFLKKCEVLEPYTAILVVNFIQIVGLRFGIF